MGHLLPLLKCVNVDTNALLALWTQDNSLKHLVSTLRQLEALQLNALLASTVPLEPKDPVIALSASIVKQEQKILETPLAQLEHTVKLFN